MKLTRKEESLSQEVQRLRAELQLLIEKAQDVLEAADADIYFDFAKLDPRNWDQGLEQFHQACKDLQTAVLSTKDHLHQTTCHALVK